MIYLNEFYLNDETKEITITYKPSELSSCQIGDVLDFVIDALNASLKQCEGEPNGE